MPSLLHPQTRMVKVLVLLIGGFPLSVTIMGREYISCFCLLKASCLVTTLIELSVRKKKKPRMKYFQCCADNKRQQKEIPSLFTVESDTKTQCSKRVNAFSHQWSPASPRDGQRGWSLGFSLAIQFLVGMLEKEEFEFSAFPLKDKEMKALQQATPTQKMAHVDPERCQLLFDDTSVKLSAH